MVKIETEIILKNSCDYLDLLILEHRNKKISNIEYKIKFDTEINILKKIKYKCKWKHKLSITILEIINKINKIILK